MRRQFCVFIRVVSCAILMLVGSSTAISQSAKNSRPVRNLGPAWSPDGQRIAFISDRDGNPEVYIMNADGSNQRNLTNYQGLDLGVTWALDSKSVLFVSRKENKQKDVYSLTIDGKHLTKITNRGDVLTAQIGSSPDGSQVVFAAGAHRDADLYIINTDGTEEFRLTDDEILNSMPAWSPDGGQIAFMSNKEEALDIYLIEPSGGEFMALTEHDNEDGHPQWSPDGKKIVFFSLRDGNSEIYVMNSNGTDKINLTKNPAHDSGPSWSPDGKKILFHSNREDDQQDIYVMAFDGSNPVRLTNGRDNKIR